MESHKLTRRDMLALFGIAGASCLFEGAGVDAETLTPAKDIVDHLLLGISDLDRGIAWLEKMTGVRAVKGGTHPGRGTQNALISLGGRRYLELLAPDPAQSTYSFAIDVRGLTEPHLITWAAATDNIDAAAKRARESGFKLLGPSDGSRARPDGKLLKWKTLLPINSLGAQGVEPIPFFIQWSADTLHPSQDSPKGCSLQSFEMEHPDAAALTDVLRKLGIEAKVRSGKSARLIAVLKAPKGEVRFI
ncbi:MAG TPA: VOC family protein [Blastocatellia bacterium]|nr:VOC family protein [Blastocatellia bacterium]